MPTYAFQTPDREQVLTWQAAQSPIPVTVVAPQNANYGTEYRVRAVRVQADGSLLGITNAFMAQEIEQQNPPGHYPYVQPMLTIQIDNPGANQVDILLCFQVKVTNAGVVTWETRRTRLIKIQGAGYVEFLG